MFAPPGGPVGGRRGSRRRCELVHRALLSIERPARRPRIPPEFCLRSRAARSIRSRGPNGWIAHAGTIPPIRARRASEWIPGPTRSSTRWRVGLVRATQPRGALERLPRLTAGARPESRASPSNAVPAPAPVRRTTRHRTPPVSEADPPRSTATSTCRPCCGTSGATRRGRACSLWARREGDEEVRSILHPPPYALMSKFPGMAAEPSGIRVGFPGDEIDKASCNRFTGTNSSRTPVFDRRSLAVLHVDRAPRPA